MIITISGKAGSGKSTVGNMLTKRMGYKRVSVGDMKRKLAKKMGLSIFEFNKLGDQPGKAQEFDLKYEQMQKDLNLKDKILLDSRLGFYCQPNAFKVFLDVDRNEAAKRIMQDKRSTDNYSSIEELAQINIQRDKTDSQRYQELYGIDHLDHKNFDLIVDTTNVSAEQVTQKIIDAFEKFKQTSA